MRRAGMAVPGVLAGLLALSALLNVVQHERLESGVSERLTDTVTVCSVRVDTVRIAQPAAVARRAVDTVYVHDLATVTVHDTVYVRLPVEERVYSDSLYRAQVSGYMPSLDWIEVYPRTVTETRTAIQKPGRWSVGIQAGCGATKDGFSPYVGIGVGWSILYF